MNDKEYPKIMLHLIMPNQISGPNTASRKLFSSSLKLKYKFEFLVQSYHAGGKINFKLIRDLKKQIKLFNPDVVHINGLQSSGFHAVLAAKLSKKKVLMTVRGFSGDDLTLKPFKRFLFKHIVEPITLLLSDRVYTVCECAQQRRELKRFRKKVMPFIHNCAPIIDFDIVSAKKVARENMGFTIDDFVVIISGRMTYDKGITYIIGAIREIMNLIPDNRLKFVFVGDGPMLDVIKSDLRVFLNSSVFCLGKVDNVLKVIVAGDLFLFATLHENLSNALLEAMAVGLSVIATNVGGNKEVVENGKNGFLIPAMSETDIVECLKRCYENPSLNESFQKCSLEIIKEKFTEKILLDKLDGYYQQMLQK